MNNAVCGNMCIKDSKHYLSTIMWNKIFKIILRFWKKRIEAALTAIYEERNFLEYVHGQILDVRYKATILAADHRIRALEESINNPSNVNELESALNSIYDAIQTADKTAQDILSHAIARDHNYYFLGEEFYG